jgi:hypothetical protein
MVFSGLIITGIPWLIGYSLKQLELLQTYLVLAGAAKADLHFGQARIS